MQPMRIIRGGRMRVRGREEKMEEGLAEAVMSVRSSARRMPAPMFMPMRARG